MITYILLTLGLFLLVYGGNMLVDGAVDLAKRLGVSSLLIGLVLVGFGTSTPELMASFISVFKDSNGIAVGNVVGSNIANILLVLGMAAFIHPVSIDSQAFKRDGLVLIIATLFLMFGIFMGVIGRMLGCVFVGTLLGYILYSYVSDKKSYQADEKVDVSLLPNLKISLLKSFSGIALTVLGAKLLVDNAIILATLWGVSESVIGLTVVAVGTSLPELTASVVASIKKENGVAFGNVIGSNIYNALFILGMVAIVVPIQIPQGMLFDMMVMAFVTAVLCAIAFWKKQFTRPIGALFLMAYFGYIWYLF